MSGYIMGLRKLVGHIPLLQCGASVIVENGKGEILLQQRTDNGCWGYAGGSVELYEVDEEAARRELEEETGLIAEEMELLGVFSGEELRYTYPNGDQVSTIDIVYVCRKYRGQLKCQRGEVEKLAYFPVDQLPSPLFAPQVPAIERYLEWRKQCPSHAQVPGN